ncbi:MAG: DUF4430 domain-containing protein [Clostridia bacterium]|nr:DUF4430 domain-containing protein [Clostridia bacterium]
MNKKQWITGVLCLCMLFAAGCGKQEPESQPDPSPTVTEQGGAPTEEPPQQTETAPEAAESQQSQQPLGSAATQKPAEAGSNAAKPAAQGDVQPAVPSVQPAAEQQPVQAPTQEKVVYLSVEIPSDSTSVISRTAVALEDGDTAYTVLRRVAKEAGIPVVASGGSKSPYVEGIDNLFEFDRGAGSGWMVEVNGNFVQRSAGQMKLNAGDEVRWIYTLELGKDVGGGI